MQALEYRGITMSLYSKEYKLQFINPNTGTVKRTNYNNIESDGIIISNSQYESRTITAQGIIIASSLDDVYFLRRKLSCACDGKTISTLYFNAGSKKYFAEAVAELPDYGNIVGNTLEFSIDFILPGFFWKGYPRICADLFRRIDHIDKSFSLPMVFTSRTMGAIVYNNGDVETPFDIELCSDVDISDEELIIENISAKSEMRLNYNISSGEKIFINTEEMTITSSINGNVNRFLDKSSSFFYLPIGENIINVRSSVNNAHINAGIIYSERFIGV